MKRRLPPADRVRRILLILTLMFIFGHSLMPGGASGEESGRLFGALEPLMRFFLPGALCTENFLRKCAHFAEYALLGLEAAPGAKEAEDGGLTKLYPQLSAGLLAAFTDETIQTFVSERNGQVRDMWIDLFGFAAGLLTGRLLRKRAAIRKNRRERT